MMRSNSWSPSARLMDIGRADGFHSRLLLEIARLHLICGSGGRGIVNGFGLARWDVTVTASCPTTEHSSGATEVVTQTNLLDLALPAVLEVDL